MHSPHKLTCLPPSRRSPAAFFSLLKVPYGCPRHYRDHQRPDVCPPSPSVQRHDDASDQEQQGTRQMGVHQPRHTKSLETFHTSGLAINWDGKLEEQAYIPYCVPTHERYVPYLSGGCGAGSKAPKCMIQVSDPIEKSGPAARYDDHDNDETAASLFDLPRCSLVPGRRKRRLERCLLPPLRSGEVPERIVSGEGEAEGAGSLRENDNSLLIPWSPVHQFVVVVHRTWGLVFGAATQGRVPGRATFRGTLKVVLTPPSHNAAPCALSQVPPGGPAGSPGMDPPTWHTPIQNSTGTTGYQKCAIALNLLLSAHGSMPRYRRAYRRAFIVAAPEEKKKKKKTSMVSGGYGQLDRDGQRAGDVELSRVERYIEKYIHTRRAMHGLARAFVHVEPTIKSHLT
ncbi:uncharacterized protein CLUP02_01315 [Colletotrichum lupini]|uniref:Uncharacterized protein n=1 Tax=Colletotrichum lupini TaxID=145971 RepID=A0A9Q8W924_9PEZI|nr:uncharacterized protein CLUP02_01315 [Colletotrichum lupini]UQC74664.1 hypothetical protein CLUP02_01315 [Colletotrichum lupini]